MTLLSTIDSLHLVESSVKNKGSSDDGVRTWSTAVQILLPVAALAILWGRRGFFTRFFLQFDKNCVSVFCPPFSKRQRLLKWASGRLPPTWSSHSNTFPGGPTAFWKDGSLLCTLINSAIPGACPNPHRHWKRPPSHGQALAYKYLGVVPVFTETELSQTGLTLRHEGALINYLLQVQQAILRISDCEMKFSSRYVARGMGLVVGEQHRKTAFYIYSSSTTSSSKHDVMVSIRGPYDTQCTATIPAYYISRKHLRNNCEDKQRLAFESRAQRFFIRTLSVDLGSFINVTQKTDIDNDMPIKLISENERVKVMFIPTTVGIHEISIITNGFHLVGSPFNVNITENTSGVTDTFNESLGYPYKKTKTNSIRKKIISKIIDFIDEKINYENLNLKPLHEISIPKIEITPTKDASEESYMDENISAKTQVIHKSMSFPNFNFEECDFKSGKEEATENSKGLLLESTPKENFSEVNFLTVQSNFLPELSNEPSDDNKFIEETEQEITDVNSYPNFRKFSSDDCNNNLIVLDSISSPIGQDFLNKSNTQSTFTTSPICFDHIEEEVNDEPNASSKVPNWNFEKKRLRRQNHVDLSVEIELNPALLSIESSVDEENENQCQISKLAHSLEMNWTVLEESKIEHQEASVKSDPTNRKFDKHIVDEVKVILEEQDMVVRRHKGFTKQNQITDKYIKSALELNTFSESNSMNILNYLSSLKIEDSNSQNIPPPKSKSKSSNLSLTNHQQEFEERITFKQRLKYWESQTNLRIIPDKRHKLRLRRSLPNLLPPSKSELFIFNEDNSNYSKTSETVEFKSHFKERQEYWKELSSQRSIDSSCISSSVYYIQTLGKLNKERIKARLSLPDLFSKASRNEVLNEMSYRNVCFPIDFFDSPEATNFKTRFKECREFWENLSVQNLNNKTSYEYIHDDCYKQDNFIDDSNFDSGFYSSLPNLSANKNDDSLKFKRLYDEKREYWEKLSLLSMSDLSLNSLLSTESNKTGGILYPKGLETQTSNEIQEKKPKTINETQKELDRPKENLRNDSPVSDKQSTNLTDDLKRINDTREKMRMHFNKAKRFFKNLEESSK